MAYAYNSIDELLNNQEQQKQNIFGSSQGGNAPQGQDGGVKTSTEGDVGSGGGGSSTPQGQNNNSNTVTDEQSQTTEAGKAAVKANTGKTAQPKVFNDIQSQIEANNQKLQDQANSYVSTQKTKQNYAIDNSNIDKAISGDSDQNSKVRSLLNRQTIDNVEAFDPGDVSVKDSSLVNTNAGLQQLVSRGQGPQYTQGMGAFDLQTLRRTPEFENIISMIRGNEANLEKTARDYTAAKPKEVADYGTANLANAQKASREFLGNMSHDLQGANEDEARVYNDALAALDLRKVAPDVASSAA